MIKKKVSFDISVFSSMDELENRDKKLMKRAVEARKNAYSPYSNFTVGAAVLLENGEMVLGNNQENAAYPSGLCAERVAVFYAGANYPGIKIKAIAITATSINYKVDTPAAPCGNCRQAISEYETKQESPIELFLMGETGKVLKCNAIADILPLAFTSSFLL
ncbi:cytidine deaminase [Maribacter vaceletii]|uniref:Cytidine deaminase n=1 Tax=Maribacter vaceletii TaxID=1206816 RepID=A0A495DST8_9FLAO|nr:cytidine deaminase [Maribacter vaceletii]RKR07712.1 cytidine deaminase [Maribacter vaceletii]